MAGRDSFPAGVPAGGGGWSEGTIGKSARLSSLAGRRSRRNAEDGEGGFRSGFWLFDPIRSPLVPRSGWTSEVRTLNRTFVFKARLLKSSSASELRAAWPQGQVRSALRQLRAVRCGVAMGGMRWVGWGMIAGYRQGWVGLGVVCLAGCAVGPKEFVESSEARLAAAAPPPLRAVYEGAVRSTVAGLLHHPVSGTSAGIASLRNRARVLVGADAKVLDIVVRATGSGYQRILTALSSRFMPASR